MRVLVTRIWSNSSFYPSDCQHITVPTVFPIRNDGPFIFVLWMTVFWIVPGLFFLLKGFDAVSPKMCHAHSNCTAEYICT